MGWLIWFCLLRFAPVLLSMIFTLEECSPFWINLTKGFVLSGDNSVYRELVATFVSRWIYGSLFLSFLCSTHGRTAMREEKDYIHTYLMKRLWQLLTFF